MSTSLVGRSNSQTYLMTKFLREYQAEHGKGPVSFSSVAVWLLNNKKWSPPIANVVSDLSKRLARAARKLHHIDVQGRRVRTMHAARYQTLTANGQLVFETIWDQLEIMSEDHARVSFTQRYNHIDRECKSLNTDMASFADNNKNASLARQLEFTFNFGFGLDAPVDQNTEVLSDDSQKPKKPR